MLRYFVNLAPERYLYVCHVNAILGDSLTIYPTQDHGSAVITHINIRKKVETDSKHSNCYYFV